MSVIEVTSREFRDNQKSYLERAKEGNTIIIRKKTDSFVITHVESGEIKLSPEMENKIDRAKMQAKSGNVKRIAGKEALTDYLNNL
ncbi:hypothetical protein LJB92_00610 [Bacteroidales bacterium OttesenSCG-928-M06]|nr:hypothetical protein [Bacteroidales bacterium OttesenSCG-928-M06]